jgi:hypothetical protein
VLLLAPFLFGGICILLSVCLGCSYRVVDAVDRLSEKEKGFKVGVINKVSVNLIDEEAMNLIGNSKFVLVCESWNEKTGLGSRVCQSLILAELWQCELNGVNAVSARNAAARTQPYTQICSNGHDQGGMRWSYRAKSVPSQLLIDLKPLTCSVTVPFQGLDSQYGPL